MWSASLGSLEDVSDGIASGNLKGRIEIYAADAATTVEVRGRSVPLELEPIAALAYQLEGSPAWDTELGGFISAFKPPYPEGLLMMHPYRPGRVPVVLVHGTASSPGRWGDIINELQNDPYEHLGMPCGLECEVPDRVDAAVASAPTPEPAAVTPEAFQDP